MKKIKVGSYVKVISGKYAGNIYKVFYLSASEDFAGIGILSASKTIKTDELLIVTEEEFYKKNFNIFSSETSFLSL